ncbi:hypothetical protein K439DRAFT_1618916 [Ramaria rubella]|nr:hypothetical protein K439DRAFT_1618916 [Ramaria rubella]
MTLSLPEPKGSTCANAVGIFQQSWELCCLGISQRDWQKGLSNVAFDHSQISEKITVIFIYCPEAAYFIRGSIRPHVESQESPMSKFQKHFYNPQCMALATLRSWLGTTSSSNYSHHEIWHTRRLTSDKTTILHTGSFQHPLLKTVIIALAFKGCLPLAATNPCHFDPIPLPMIVFICTLIHHVLDHHLTDDPSACHDLLGPNYCPIFQSYLEGLELFKHENPGLCAVVQREL